MPSVSPLIVAGLALALAGPALAASPMSPSGGSTVPPTAPTASQPPAQAPAPPAEPSTPPTASEPASPSQQTAPSAQGSSAPASATAPGTQAAPPASYTVGENVKDNTGASIGSITSLTGSGASQMAVIKMGDQSFQVQTSRLGSADGAAEINMTKAQIAAMLHSSSK